MTTRQKELTSIGFILGLSVLLLNDFYLKNHFGNWWTGKLSDFAGLFIFPIFWTIIFPQNKDKIYIATTILFVYWKCPYSQNFIDAINDFSLFKISRTVDLSDYIALLIIPFSYLYHGRQKKYYIFIKPKLVLVITAFSFLATSYDTQIDFKKTYKFNYSLDTLKSKIFNLNDIDNFYKRETNIDSAGIIRDCKLNHDFYGIGQRAINLFVEDTMALHVYDDICGGYDANFIISGDNQKSTILLLGFHHRCPENNDDKKRLSKSFEYKIISQLTDK